MGLLDKAKAAAQDAAEKGKKLADQAQAKIEETQNSFNEGRAGDQGTKAPAVEYDQHGRPIAGDTVAEAVQNKEPLAEPAPEDTAPPQGDPLADEAPSKTPPAGPSSGSGLTSGDPLDG